MARTAVDLPDPLENPVGGALNGAADDLLAQLAGDEVDRLLSEADVGGPEAQNVDLPIADSLNELELLDTAPATSGDAVLDATEALLDEDEEEAAPSGFEAAPAGTTGARQQTLASTATGQANLEAGDATDPTESAEAMISRRADALIAAAKKADATGQNNAPGITAPPATAAGPPSAADALLEEMEADEAAHMAALQRLKKSSGAAKSTPAPAPVAPAPAVTQPTPPQPAAPAIDADEPTDQVIDEETVDLSAPTIDDSAEPATPLLVRILEWINAPLDGLSTGVREAIGKVALITSVNAIAVFAYVLFFRKH